MMTLLVGLLLSGIVPGPAAMLAASPQAPGGTGASPRTLLAAPTPVADAQEVVCLQQGYLGGIKIPADTAEVANDCPDAGEVLVTKAIWWGGYTAWHPGDPDVMAFDVRFYQNLECTPSALLAEYLAVTPDTTRLGNCDDGLPCFRYELDVAVYVSGPFWFSIMVTPGGEAPDARQGPPKWGRLGDEIDFGCQTSGRPDAYGIWIPLELPPDSDASQAFEIDVATPAAGPTWGTIKAKYW